MLRLGSRRTRPAFREKHRVTLSGNFVAFQLPKGPGLASETSSSGAGPASTVEVSQVLRTAVPARGVAAARRSQSGGGSRARNLWLAGPSRRVGGRLTAGEVRAEPGRWVCSLCLARPCTAGEQSAVSREPLLGGNKTLASNLGSPD